MKFREYGDVIPTIVTALDAQGLCKGIDELGSKQDLIDLQYSTTTLNDGRIEYSALALVKVKKENT